MSGCIGRTGTRAKAASEGGCTTPEKAETAVAVVTPKAKAETDTMGAIMRAGFLARGEYEARRTEVENHLWTRQMIETGEYKAVVAALGKSVPSCLLQNEKTPMKDGNTAEKSVPSGTDLEPKEAFLKLIGTSLRTYNRREGDVRNLGLESVSAMRGLGLQWHEVRMLADAPEDIRKEAQGLAERGEFTREAAEALMGKLVELAESRQTLKQRTYKAESEREQAEAKARKNAQKVVEKDEHVKKLESELRDARNGMRSKDEKECQMMVEAFEKLSDQAVAQLHGVDFDHSPRTRALLMKALGRMETQIKSLRAEFINVVEESE